MCARLRLGPVIIQAGGGAKPSRSWHHFSRARRLLGIGMFLGARFGGGVSKANFQSRSRVPSLIKERRAVSGLRVVMETEAWCPGEGRQGTNGCPAYRIPVKRPLIDGVDGPFVIL